MSRRMIKRPGFWLIVIIGCAAVFTFLKVPVASSQGVSIVAEYVPGDIAVKDFAAEGWKKATAVEVPISAQVSTKPMLMETRIKSVTARAIHNGKQIAFLIEWTDDTKNDSMVRVQDFHDGVAVQFPIVTQAQPFFCMGQAGSNVNIWYWRADWQTDIAARQDMEALYPNMYTDNYPFADPNAGLRAGPGTYTDPNYLTALAAGNLFASAEHASPVEDLNAGGFGTLTSQPAKDQNIQGYGEWATGKWRAIFTRPMITGQMNDVVFAPGVVYSMAFAAWDGANNERNGQKSTSQWVSLQLKDSPALQTPVAVNAPAAATKPYDLSGVVAVLAGPLLVVGGAVTTLFLGVVVFLLTRKGDEQ
ncbi:MAG: hypothetical protein IT324_08360 [Anaerolineae bacterium]|nr:hypothetical protein [Anaerolineae bacterium]